MRRAKTFDACIVGTITTGVVLHSKFSDVHKCLEHVMGHPVWTHEMPAIMGEARARVIAIYPDFPAEPPNDWRAMIARLAALYPDGLVLPKGDSRRSASPLETLKQAMRGHHAE